MAGAIALPQVFAADLKAAVSESTATTAPAQPGATAEASPTPSSLPTVNETGAPLDSEATNVVALDAAVSAPKTQPAFATKAIDLLATLPIKGRAPKTGYDRGLFGQAWADVDRNGCDTRNDTLKRA